MNKRLIRIIIGIIGIILLIIVISFFIFRSGTPLDTSEVPVQPTGSLPQPGNVGMVTEPIVTPTLDGVGVNDPNFELKVIAEDLKKRSIIVLERVGSYSSDSSLTNFDDIIPQTTAVLENVLRNKKEQLKNAYAREDDFEGYTVTAVTSNANTTEYVNGRIVITIDAVRESTIGKLQEATNNNVTYLLTWDQGEDFVWRLAEISGNF